MFWGLIMEPNKRYTQVVQRSFHISMAALDTTSEQNQNVQVLVGINDKNFLLCNLNTKNILQTPLDLNFQSGDKIAFMHSGSGYVHLTGYLVPEDDLDEMLEEEAAEEEVPELVKPDKKPLKRKGDEEKEIKTKKKKLPTADLLEALANESDDNDESFIADALASDSDDSDDDDDEESDAEDDEEAEGEGEGEEEEESDDDDDEDENEESSDDEDMESEEEEEAEETVVEKKPSKKDKKQKIQNGTVSPKKDKKKKQQEENSAKKGASEESPKTKKQENQQQKKDKSKKKDTNKQEDKADKKGADKENKPLKKTVEGGVHIEDLKVGSGAVAKPGKFVQVYYEGRLKSNGKQFDASKTGPGFKFRLGKKEVIQGWDIGVAGMRVGGKRRITCPPHMAYGAKGSPPVIPPNSTLVFEVELRSVN